MSDARRRRRGLTLVALAVVCGGLAASEVGARSDEARRSVGEPTPVVVAAGDIESGTKLGRRAAGELLSVRQVPAAFVGPDSFAAPEELVGGTVRAPIQAGAAVTTAHLADRGTGNPFSPTRLGQRTIEIPVAGAGTLADPAPGTRVDVIVSSEVGADGRSYVALESVQLLGLAEGAAEPELEGRRGGGALATLLVESDQAVLLTAAANFAGEVRLLERPPGDERPVGAATVRGGEL